MTCTEATRRHIACHGGALPAEVADHFSRCESCRRLVRAVQKDLHTAPAPSQLEHIKSVLLADLRAVKPLPSPATRLAILSLLVLAVLAAGTLLTGVQGWLALTVTGKLAVFAPLLLAACLLGKTLVDQMVPGSASRGRAVAWCAASFASLVSVVLLTFSRQEEPEFVATGLNCFGVGMLFAGSAAVVVWLVIRGGAILSSGWTGTIAGILAGFIALAGIEVRCPSPNGNHILFWHLPLVLAGTLGGLAVGLAGGRLARRHSRSRSV